MENDNYKREQKEYSITHKRIAELLGPDIENSFLKFYMGDKTAEWAKQRDFKVAYYLWRESFDRSNEQSYSVEDVWDAGCIEYDGTITDFDPFGDDSFDIPEPDLVLAPKPTDTMQSHGKRIEILEDITLSTPLCGISFPMQDINLSINNIPFVNNDKMTTIHCSNINNQQIVGSGIIGEDKGHFLLNQFNITSSPTSTNYGNLHVIEPIVTSQDIATITEVDDITLLPEPSVNVKSPVKLENVFLGSITSQHKQIINPKKRFPAMKGKYKFYTI